MKPAKLQTCESDWLNYWWHRKVCLHLLTFAPPGYGWYQFCTSLWKQLLLFFPDDFFKAVLRRRAFVAAPPPPPLFTLRCCICWALRVCRMLLHECQCVYGRCCQSLYVLAIQGILMYFIELYVLVLCLPAPTVSPKGALTFSFKILQRCWIGSQGTKMGR